MLRAIVGFEIRIAAIAGKFKGSQNRAAADRAGVDAALRTAGRNSRDVSELVPP